MVTLHTRGEAGKPPFHGLRTRVEVSLDARGRLGTRLYYIGRAVCCDGKVRKVLKVTNIGVYATCKLLIYVNIYFIMLKIVFKFNFFT